MNLSKFLEGLDLTNYEKEVIIFLSSIDTATAREIYKTTKVPLGRIYSVLNVLVEKGIVQLVLTIPKRYKIENVKEALTNYLERVKRKVEEKAEELQSVIIGHKLIVKGGIPSITFFSGREEHAQALATARNRAQKEILQMAYQFIGSFIGKVSYLKALERGVKVKILVPKVTDINKQKIKVFLEAGAEIRFSKQCDLKFQIVDQKEFVMGLENHELGEERLTILSTHRGLKEILLQQFWNVWEGAKEISIKEL